MCQYCTYEEPSVEGFLLGLAASGKKQLPKDFEGNALNEVTSCLVRLLEMQKEIDESAEAPPIKAT